MDSNHENSAEIESELFALLNSIINLHDKYKEGKITRHFFRKALKNAMKGLLKIKFHFKDKSIPFTEALHEMKLMEKYDTALDIFNKFSNLSSNNQVQNLKTLDNPHLENEKQLSILELPRITSEITSSFITLMDALKLGGIKDISLIFNLFKDLKNNIKKFPGISGIRYKIKEIDDQISKNPRVIVDNKKFREIIVEKLYQVYNEFTQKLALE
ncbi:MAG: hypothetical protein EU539_02295 [Promethearchaeota archaeon]|nr:MAG: hypothetical protein EU539_02295 [Candidatus Lokiarchaeota archaeon]